LYRLFYKFLVLFYIESSSTQIVCNVIQIDVKAEGMSESILDDRRGKKLKYYEYII